jgi:hypothetical protein
MKLKLRNLGSWKKQKRRTYPLSLTVRHEVEIGISQIAGWSYIKIMHIVRFICITRLAQTPRRDCETGSKMAKGVEMIWQWVWAVHRENLPFWVMVIGKLGLITYRADHLWEYWYGMIIQMTRQNCLCRTKISSKYSLVGIDVIKYTRDN